MAKLKPALWAFVQWQSVRRSIGTLNFWRRPAAVARIIRSIVVDAIQRGFGKWFPPHVGDELLELRPFRANSNPSRAVTLIARIIRIGTSLPHTAPGIMFGRKLKSKVCCALNIAFSQLLAKQAAARLRVSGQKRIGPHQDLFATRASTIPTRTSAMLPFFGRPSARDSQSAESKATQIPAWSWHMTSIPFMAVQTWA